MNDKMTSLIKLIKLDTATFHGETVDPTYAAIVAVAECLPEQTIQEDPNLLMYYDISLSRV